MTDNTSTSESTFTETFVDVSTLPYTSQLEEAADVIRGELQTLHAAAFAPWPERDLYSDGWGVFGLIAFGQRVEAHCALCPRTVEVLQKIEQETGLRVVTAGFSCLASGVHIVPHSGKQKISFKIVV